VTHQYAHFDLVATMLARMRMGSAMSYPPHPPMVTLISSRVIVLPVPSQRVNVEVSPILTRVVTKDRAVGISKVADRVFGFFSIMIAIAGFRACCRPKPGRPPVLGDVRPVMISLLSSRRRVERLYVSATLFVSNAALFHS